MSYFSKKRVRPLTVSQTVEQLMSHSSLQHIRRPLFTPYVPRLVRPTMDGLQTIDQAAIDSTGAFVINELERLDYTLHDPLVAVFWHRDIVLREDVTIGDELSSFTNSSFAAPGGMTPGGKAWIGKDTNAITSIALDIGKTVSPLYLWAMELSYTIPELASAQQLGRPIDQQKYNGLKLKHQMDIDEQCYIGDTQLGAVGMLNNTAISTLPAPATGTGASALWTNKTADQILEDFNLLLTGAWAAAAWSVVPANIRMPPAQFGYIAQAKVSDAGNESILSYVKRNCITTVQNGVAPDIQALKWCIGRGAGGTDRMIAYTKNKEYMRFPMTALQRTPVEARSIYQLTTYYCRLGVMEFPYLETSAYMDGI